MKQTKCYNCGSSISSEDDFCSYCGANLREKNSQQEKLRPNKTHKMSDEALSTVLTSQTGELGKEGRFAMFFFLILMFSALGGICYLVISSSDIPAIFIAPVAIFVFIVTIIIVSTMKQEKNAVTKKLAIMFNKYEYEKAYRLIQKELQKSKGSNFRKILLTQAIIIGYYKLNKVDDVNAYISLLTELEEEPNPQISKIAKALNVEYNPKPFEEDADFEKYEQE